MTYTVLFVCTGNVCRSPMATGFFNAKALAAGEAHLYCARSAGTRALVNQPASANAIVVMHQRGIDITAHSGKMITVDDLDQAAVVIVMSRSHYEALATEFPVYRHKLHLMSELKGPAFDIGDPYGEPLAEYQSCARELENLIEHGYEKIKSWISINAFINGS